MNLSYDLGQTVTFWKAGIMSYFLEAAETTFKYAYYQTMVNIFKSKESRAGKIQMGIKANINIRNLRMITTVPVDANCKRAR